MIDSQYLIISRSVCHERNVRKERLPIPKYLTYCTNDRDLQHPEKAFLFLITFLFKNLS